MSEKLPFEENMDQQFNKLPIPDEEHSWQKMKALLDEEDERRRPVFFWFSGRVWGILLLALATGAYFLFFNNNSIESNISQTSTPQTSDPTVTSKPGTEKNQADSNPSSTAVQSEMPGDSQDNSSITKGGNSTPNKTNPTFKANAVKPIKTLHNNQKNNNQKASATFKTEVPALTTDENSRANTVESRDQMNRIENTDVNLTVQETDTESANVKNPNKNTRKRDSVKIGRAHV